MEGSIDDNRLLALLLQERKINKRQLKEIQTEMERSKKPLKLILRELSIVNDSVLNEMHAKVMGLDYVSIRDFNNDPNLYTLISKKYAVEHRTIPLKKSGNSITIAIERPDDAIRLMDEIQMMTGMEVKVVICDSEDIEFGLSNYPEGEDLAEQVIAYHVSPARQAIQFLVFLLLMMVPLGILVMVAANNQVVNNWLIGNENDISNIIAVLIVWGFYDVILYYIYGLFVDKSSRPWRW